jgi:hypothetical protein
VSTSPETTTNILKAVHAEVKKLTPAEKKTWRDALDEKLASSSAERIDESEETNRGNRHRI